MAVFVGSEAIVCLIVMCLATLLHAQDASTQVPDHSTTTAQADDSTEITPGKRRSPFDTGASARTETTPAVCSPGIICEFHQYHSFDTRDEIVNVHKYCTCPEGEECVRGRDNMEQKVFEHKCSNRTESATRPMSTDRGETEQGSETPLSTGVERTETPESVDPTATEMDSTITRAARSVRKLHDRVGELKEHLEL